MLLSPTEIVVSLDPIIPGKLPRLTRESSIYTCLAADDLGPT